jgi:uncharacterized membrane protein YccF (DUF307 family)
MLRDILNGDMPGLPSLFSGLHLSSEQMMIIGLFTAAAAYMLVRVAAGVRIVTLPICFSSLFICAMVANWYFSDVYIHGISEVQKTLILTVVGHVVASIILLFGFRTERA